MWGAQGKGYAGLQPGEKFRVWHSGSIQARQEGERALMGQKK